MSDSPAAQQRRRAAWRRPLLGRMACVVYLLATSGCGALGFLVSRVVPAPLVPAKYAGLQGQSIAIMVWAGEGTLIDFSDVRLDVASSLQNKLEQARVAKVKQLKGISFPTPAASVIRFQENHPELEGAPLTDLAPQLGASRVIYVEIENLQTRSDAAVELYRGSASATLKVVEVADGRATIAYEETGISTTFPPKVTDAGTPDGNDSVFYGGTVDTLTTEIAKRFVEYPEEP